MRIATKFHKLLSLALVSSLSSISFYAPVVQASLIGTSTALAAPTFGVNGERAHVLALLQRQDVQSQLQVRGVDPAQVQARVNALNNSEVHALATQLDQAPAGAGGLEVVLLVFLILIITDLAGITHIFTFVH